MDAEYALEDLRRWISEGGAPPSNESLGKLKFSLAETHEPEVFRSIIELIDWAKPLRIALSK